MSTGLIPQADRKEVAIAARKPAAQWTQMGRS